MRIPLLLTCLLALAVPATSLANAYAPWVDCMGLAAGDTCGEKGGYYYGICTMDDPCTDDSGTEENECLICADDPDAHNGCSATGRLGAVFGLQALAGLAGLLLMARRRRS